MNCYYHINTPAVSTCAKCGKSLCRDCVDKGFKFNGHLFCFDCSFTAQQAYVNTIKKKKSDFRFLIYFCSITLVIGLPIFLLTMNNDNYWIGMVIMGIGCLPSVIKLISEIIRRTNTPPNDGTVIVAGSYYDAMRGCLPSIVILGVIIAIICYLPLACIIVIIYNIVQYFSYRKKVSEAENILSQIIQRRQEAHEAYQNASSLKVNTSNLNNLN